MRDMTLLGRTIFALGAKRAARALSLSLGYCYALARPAADPAHPENTGTERDPLTRIESLLETLSTHPRHRPLLREWQLHFDALFRRLLDRDEAEPVDDAHIILDAADCAKESGEAVAETLRRAAEHGHYGEALREVTEAIDRLEHVARALRRRAEEDRGTPALPLRRRA